MLLCLLLLAGCGTKAPGAVASTSGGTPSPEAQTPTEKPISAPTMEPTAGPTTEPTAEPVSGAALTVRGVEYSVEQATMSFLDQFYLFANSYGAFAAYYGLDLSAGVESLSRQTCDFSPDGTWYGYFLEQAVSYLAQLQALCDYAAENGIALTEADDADIGQVMDSLRQQAEAFGYASAEDYLAEYYCEGVTEAMYLEYLRSSTLADLAYRAYMDSLVFSEDEIAAHYLTMGYEAGTNDYPVTAMRHILIMAEADENGAYTEEAIAAAHEQAVRLYEEWSAGEKTEESFAALADARSADGGSVGSGGLYENIYQGQMVGGINDWLFAEGRAVGDTAVIDNNGSYVGTHIVYFVGCGERYSSILAREDLQYLALNEWFAELTADYVPQPGAAYERIGKFGG